MGNTFTANINEDDGIHSELSWEAVEDERDNDYVFPENELKLFTETDSDKNCNASIISIGTTIAQKCFNTVTLVPSPLSFQQCDFLKSSFETLLCNYNMSYKEERLFRGRLNPTSLFTLIIEVKRIF